MEIEIEEVGPSSRPFRYVSQQPPPPPPPPPGMMGGPTSSAGVLGPGEAGAPPPASVAAQQNQFDSEKVPQTLVSDVRPFLRVANDVEADSPRVAYLCKSRAAYTPASLSLSLSLFLLPLHGTSARARATCSWKCRCSRGGIQTPEWVYVVLVPILILPELEYGRTRDQLRDSMSFGFTDIYLLEYSVPSYCIL
jgi:hypothetical protein